MKSVISFVFLLLFLSALALISHQSRDVDSFVSEFPIAFESFVSEKIEHFEDTDKAYFIKTFDCPISNIDYDIFKKRPLRKIIPRHFNLCLQAFESKGDTKYHKNLIERYDLYEKI